MEKTKENPLTYTISTGAHNYISMLIIDQAPGGRVALGALAQRFRQRRPVSFPVRRSENLGTRCPGNYRSGAAARAIQLSYQFMRNALSRKLTAPKMGKNRINGIRPKITFCAREFN